MNELKIFENPVFGQVRTVEREGEPWFVGKDVAQALGYSNTRDALDRHVDDEDKNTVVNFDGNRGNPNMTIINEPGLYSGETMKGNKPVKKRDLFDIINRNGMEYIAALLAYAIALEKQMAKASAT